MQTLRQYFDAPALVDVLFEAFPPESDPIRQGAYNVGPDDSARRLRDQLVNWLSEQGEIKAVEALRLLEQRFGAMYPWLRRPRARAEEVLRRSCWMPIPPRSVAEVLTAQSKRLIRSEQDAVEGVVEAISDYVHRLRHGGLNDLEDFWNCPSGEPPTPRKEERVSDKICGAIRLYFEQYAVTADREVQISRRILSQADGGAPGSKIDVTCRIPAAGAVDVYPIAVPVEVKWSHNPEARTGLGDQLVERYVSEIGARGGVFVVAWSGVLENGSSYRPVWKSLSEARDELEDQAKRVSARTGFHIEAVVIDVSLPTAVRESKRGQKTGARGSSRGAKSKGSGNRKKRADAGAKKGKRRRKSQ